MSVTIVSALPPSNMTNQANGAESTPGSDGGMAGLAFADVLLSQKLMNFSAKADEPIASEETEAGLAPTSTGEVDAASILAALGLATQQPANASNTAEQSGSTSGTGKASDSAIGLVQAGAGSEKSLKPEGLPQTEPDSALAAAPGIDDKPAKFAVATPTVPESTSKTEPAPSTDTQPKTVSTLANLPATTVQRDAPLAMQAHIRNQSWSSEFSQKIVWLANADKQSAQLTLNPPQIGPIEISLNVEKGSASASFVSANQEVRDAIETALPRLREMFASAGIQLGQTNVSSESFRQQSENNAGSQARSQAGVDNDILAGNSGGSLTTRAFAGQAANGLVDLFA